MVASRLDREALDALVARTLELEQQDAITRLRSLLDDAEGTHRAVGPAIAGAGDDPPSALDAAAAEAVTRLFECAQPTVLAFVGVLPIAATLGAVSELFTGTPRDVLRWSVFLRDYVKTALRGAIRLITGGLRKLLRAIDLDGERFLAAVDGGFGAAETWFKEIRENVSAVVIGKIVRRKRSEEMIDELLTRTPPELRDNPPGEVINSFTRLNASFDDKQRRARRVAGVVGSVSPLLVVLHPPFGPAGLLAAVLIGCTYSLVGLADRLDTTHAPLPHRTQGVPSLLRAHLSI